MSRLLPVFLLILGCIGLWLLYQNRSSPRIQETTGVIMAVILGSLFFVIKDEQIEKSAMTLYLLNTKEGKILFPDHPGLSYYHMWQNAIHTSYQQQLAKSRSSERFDFPSDFGPLVELHSATILNHLLSFYGTDWYVESDRRHSLLGDTISYKPIPSQQVQSDLTRLPKGRFPDPVMRNSFFSAISPLNDSLALPKNTDFSYHVDPNGLSCEYRFTKRLSFDIRIRVSFRSYSAGMRGIDKYLGITDPSQGYVLPDSPFGSVVLITKCNAEFSRIRTWNPAVVRYKRWAQNLFNDLHDTLDWSKCEATIKEHQQFLANQKVINSMK